MAAPGSPGLPLPAVLRSAKRPLPAMSPSREVDFGGDTDFSDAAFADGADRLPFKLTRVLSPGAHHVWPAGWGVGPEGKAGHLVVRVKHDGRS